MLRIIIFDYRSVIYRQYGFLLQRIHLGYVNIDFNMLFLLWFPLIFMPGLLTAVDVEGVRDGGWDAKLLLGVRYERSVTVGVSVSENREMPIILAALLSLSVPSGSLWNSYWSKILIEAILPVILNSYFFVGCNVRVWGGAVIENTISSWKSIETTIWW